MLAKRNSRQTSYARELCRPVCVGLLTALASMAALTALFSLILLLIENAAHSAVVPMALISAGLGCFIGGAVCAFTVKRGGVVLGMVIGFALFLLICIIGLFGGEFFGTKSAIKFVLLVAFGGAGGYFGGETRRKKR